jgi:anti-anti-sigma factor
MWITNIRTIGLPYSALPNRVGRHIPRWAPVPVGMLGGGFPADNISRGVALGAQTIVVDGRVNPRALRRDRTQLGARLVLCCGSRSLARTSPRSSTRLCCSVDAAPSTYRGVVTVAFSGTARRVSDGAVNVELSGELRGDDIVRLQMMIFNAIVGGLPDELVVDLDGVTFLGRDGHWVLLSGYVIAVEYGTWYRVVNARDQVRDVLQANRTLDVLADSRDLGALLLALLLGPVPDGRGSL